MNRTQKQLQFNRTGQGGQVLVCALIFMLVIVVAVFFLFDVHTVIRGKVKGQSAVDAAALAGATWQQHSLNLIGELNIVKMMTILTREDEFKITKTDKENIRISHLKEPSEYVDENGNFDSVAFRNDIKRVEDELRSLQSALSLLDQMQTRVSFVLPLIGYGAAQQAAKNNGLASNQDAGDVVRDHYLAINDDTLYGDPDVAPLVIHGYFWRKPYSSMILSILTSGKSTSGTPKDSDLTGIAVATSENRLGTPFLSADPPNKLTSYISSRQFYDAVHANSWCYLRDILELDYNGAWWGNFKCDYQDSFLEQSEILPIHIDYFTGLSPYNGSDPRNFFSNRISEDNVIVPIAELYDNQNPYSGISYDSQSGLIDITGLKFDSNGFPIKNPKDTDNCFNIMPEFTWCVYDSYWTEYDEEQINYWNQYLRADFKPGYDYFSGALSWFDMRQKNKTLTGDFSSGEGNSTGQLGNALSFKDKTAANRINAAQSNLRGGVQQIQADALAKPFGRIKLENGQFKSPMHAGNMILPVFNDIAILPVALEPVYGYSQIDKYWILFLTKYIPILGDSQSLEECWSRVSKDYPQYAGSFRYWHDALVKLSNEAWRQKGIKWLNTPVAYKIQHDSDTDEDTKIPVKFNKDNCESWPVGGSSTHTHKGPGKLH